MRDLGGFPTRDGRETRWGAVVRSDSPARLTPSGWEALRAHGVRTIVDLRDPSELRDDEDARGLEHVHAPVVDFADAAFWEPWRGNLDRAGFYRALLEHWPERFAAAVSAVARARPGGVLIHCQVGRDRTGVVAALLLSLAGVAPEEIAADYALSADRLRPLYDTWIAGSDDPVVRAQLERDNVSEPAAMLQLLEGLDAESYLLEAGATDDDVRAIRERLLA